MSKTKLDPIGSNIIVKIAPPELKEAEGIIITPTEKEKDETPQEGIVVAIGKKVDLKIKVGKRVIFNKYSGATYNDGVDSFIIITSDDVYAVFK